MKIQKIKINNIGPYKGDHEFVLNDRGLVMVMGDNQDEFRMNSNGSGKSWLFDALDWCLFGKVPRGDHIDSVITDGEKQGEVTCYLISDDNEKVDIIRSRSSKTSLSLFVDGKDETALDISETQIKVEKALGLDREIFHSTVLFSQTDLAHYADSTDKQRMDILTKILGLNELDSLLDKTKIELDTLNSDQEKYITRLQVIEGELHSISVEDTDFKIADFESNRQQALTEMESLLVKYRTDQQQCVVPEVDKLQQDILGLKGQLKTRVPSVVMSQDLELRKQQFYKLGADKEIKHQYLQSIERDIEALNVNISGGLYICDHCGQEVSKAHLEKQLSILMGNLSIAKSDLEDLTRAKRSLSDQIKSIEEVIEKELIEIDTHNSGIQEKIGEANVVMAHANSIRDRWNLLEANINGLVTTINTKREEENPWVTLKETILRKQAELSDKRDALNVQLGNISQLKSYYEFWKKAFGSKGLKSYILDSKLKLLNDYINRWVKLLTHGTIWVEFGSTKTTRSGKTVNSPDIKVFRWNVDNTITERNYRSWSGGEKQRISLAIDFGLSLLVSSRAKYKYDIIILDEIFKHLDSSGKEAVIELLHELAHDKASVFVIDHDAEFQNMFDNKIIIRKKDGISCIMEQENEQQEQNETQSEILPTRAVRRRFPVRQPVSV